MISKQVRKSPIISYYYPTEAYTLSIALTPSGESKRLKEPIKFLAKGAYVIEYFDHEVIVWHRDTENQKKSDHEYARSELV